MLHVRRSLEARCLGTAHLAALHGHITECDLRVGFAGVSRAGHGVLAIGVLAGTVLRLVARDLGHDLCVGLLALCTGREYVDDGVPGALEGQDDGGDDIQTKARLVLVDELIESVGG